MSNQSIVVARRLTAVCAGMALLALAQGVALAADRGRTSSARPAPISGQVRVESAQTPGQTVSSAREVATPKDWQDLPVTGAAPVPSAPLVHEVSVVRQTAAEAPATAAPEPIHPAQADSTKSAPHAARRVAHHVAQAKVGQRGATTSGRRHGPAQAAAPKPSVKARHGQLASTPKTPMPKAGGHLAHQHEGKPTKAGTSAKALAHARSPASGKPRHLAELPKAAAHQVKPGHPAPHLAQSGHKAATATASASTQAARGPRTPHHAPPRGARKVSAPADAMPQGPRRHRPVA